MKLFHFLMLIVVSLLVACEPVTLTETVEVEPRALPSPTNQATISPTTESGTDDEGSSVASPLPEPTATDDEADSGDRRAVFPNTIIVYWREGRFPDSPQEWTFYHTGRIVAGDGSEWQIPEQDVKSLFQVAEGPDFWELGNKYTLAGECLDCFTQTLTVYYQGEIKEITVIQEPLDLPVSLRLVLDKVSSMASSQ